MKQVEIADIMSLAGIATEVGADHLAEEASGLAQRLIDGLFYVACVGQFKRGKSSLLNALLSAPILPVGVIPVTAVVTVIRYGEHRSARVRLQTGQWSEIDLASLAEYVTEEQNPENRKGVAAVEVSLPSPMLASGMCLVDTPGIGSVFLGNTEATKAFVPHIDAALIVLGADPPISADEFTLVKSIAGQCQHLLFVLNKADKLLDVEQEEARRFTSHVLTERLGMTEPALFSVSAIELLAGTRADREWRSLVDALDGLAHHSSGALVQAAAQRGFSLLARRLQGVLNEELGALRRPVEESERRVDALCACVGDAERSLSDLDFLFAAEQARLGRIFDGKKSTFLAYAQPESQDELINGLRAAKPRRGPALRRAGINLSHAIAQQRLDAWVAEVEPLAESLYVEATSRFVDLANGFLEKLAGSGESAFANLPKVTLETGFRVRSGLFYTFLMSWTGQGLIGWLLDLIRSRERQLRALDRSVGWYLNKLFVANTNRIVSDFNTRVLESRRRFQYEVRKYLQDVAQSTARALDRAKARHHQGRAAVQGEIERITALHCRLSVLGDERKGDNP